MPTRITDAAQNAAVNAVTVLTDAAAAAGTLKIYTGTQPADADDAPTGTLLATFTLSDPAFAAAVAGSAALDVTPPVTTTGAAAGTAGYFLIEDSNGLNILMGNITATGGGGDITLDNTSIAVDQTVNLTSLSVAIAASE